MSQDAWEVIKQIQTRILGSGKIVVRCNCTVHDGSIYRGRISSVLDVVNMLEVDPGHCLIWHRFESLINCTDAKFEYLITSKNDVQLIELEKEPNAITKQLAIWLCNFENSLVRWGARDSICFVRFLSGTAMENVAPCHPLILPTLEAAYVNLSSHYRAYADEIAGQDKRYTGAAFESLQQRYSAYVALARRQLLQQSFGIS